MGNKMAFIAPILVILVSILFLSSSSKGVPISKQFSFNLLSPTPYKQYPNNPTSTLQPTATPYINPKSYLPATKVYTSAQIQFLKTHDIYKYIANIKFPPLPSTDASNQSLRPVYLIDCQLDNSPDGLTIVPLIDYIPRDNSPIFRTLDLFTQKGMSEYPDESTIANYQTSTGLVFKHRVGGVNQVILDSSGRLRINFYDSVRAYGGGSSRVNCMGIGTILTAMQFPQVTSLLSCIDKMPTSPDSCPYEFQP